MLRHIWPRPSKYTAAHYTRKKNKNNNNHNNKNTSPGRTSLRTMSLTCFSTSTQCMMYGAKLLLAVCRKTGSRRNSPCGTTHKDYRWHERPCPRAARVGNDPGGYQAKEGFAGEAAALVRVVVAVHAAHVAVVRPGEPAAAIPAAKKHPL